MMNPKVSKTIYYKGFNNGVLMGLAIGNILLSTIGLLMIFGVDVKIVQLINCITAGLVAIYLISKIMINKKPR